MEYAGLHEINRQRLQELVAQLSREMLLAEGYPDVQARLAGRRIRAQIAMEELSQASIGKAAS